MNLIENTFNLNTKLLKEDLKKAREREPIDGFLNINYNGRPSVVDYYVEYENEKTYLIINFGEKPQRILLSEEELTFGNRSYLTCTCGNRVNALYLDKGVFACRDCHKLKYQSTTINRNSKHGQFLYQQSQILKLMSLRESMSHIFYKSQYTKKFNRYLDLCSRAGLTSETLDAKELMTAINQS